MKRLELTDFTPHIGTIFSFGITIMYPASEGVEARTEESIAELKLTSAKAYQLDPRDGRISDTSGKYRSVPFSAYFEDERTQFLHQGLYLAMHPGFAEPLEIFIVPVGPSESGKGFLYEAVFA